MRLRDSCSVRGLGVRHLSDGLILLLGVLREHPVDDWTQEVRMHVSRVCSSCEKTGEQTHDDGGDAPHHVEVEVGEAKQDERLLCVRGSVTIQGKSKR